MSSNHKSPTGHAWRSPFRRAILASLLVLVSASLLSCETLQFYSQAVRGQLAIVMNREDIQRLLDGGELDARLAGVFREVMDIRRFAAGELLLPVDENYASYVDVEREHVVWNVFAAPEFSTDPISWCFPIAGCVTYRGYFSEQGALRYATALEAEGYDVYTGGVDAYSTLGWFDDSLLSTVISRDNHQLAGLIFHELAHQVVYVPGDTTFNESFATAVEREGVRRWLLTTGREQLIKRADLNQRRQREFVALVTEYRQRLQTLYDTELDIDAMRNGKSMIQSELRGAYSNLKTEWGGYSGYDDWFSRSLNNAQLVTVSSYNDLVPHFDALLARLKGDLARFYAEVEALGKLDTESRQARLQSFLGPAY